ncbi:hypothetical protein RhiXN_00246 [Rhizoctonia solani]|uniref:Uncharacterized protein n=1 Tax=Rhizoctonia solani TaxID=456999 RepID=A0A8H8NUE7_9AGAM|nr:uncharacterized protein RhiXN_00246 [Rhizoctonia solani]QRW18840.1 hypothetical protein RhiXN_00246 [Rhizoctonia solani]
MVQLAVIFGFLSEYALKRLRNYSYLPMKNRPDLPVSVDFILVNTDEEESEVLPEFDLSNADSKNNPSLHAEDQLSSIPSIIDSDTLPSAAYPSGNFLDLRATYHSLPLPMGISGGPELCISTTFKGYHTVPLAPSIYLVLGSCALIATIFLVFNKFNNQGLVPNSFGEGVDINNTFISTRAAPTPEAVLEHTLELYGYIVDPDPEDAIFNFSQCSSPSNKRPNPPALIRKALHNRVLKDLNIVICNPVSSTRMTKERNILGARFSSSANSTFAVNLVARANSRPIVHMPTRTSLPSICTQASGLYEPAVPRPIQVCLGIRPGVLPQFGSTMGWVSIDHVHPGGNLDVWTGDGVTSCSCRHQAHCSYAASMF